MLFFLRSWCYFSSSAVALLVGISKFKHIYEAELQLSTRFPFHCQDRFLLWFKWWSQNEVEQMLKKFFQRVPKWTQKLSQIDKSVFWRGLKRRPQKGTLSRIRDFAVIYYTLARSEVSKKITFWVPFWGRFWFTFGIHLGTLWNHFFDTFFDLIFRPSFRLPWKPVLAMEREARRKL